MNHDHSQPESQPQPFWGSRYSLGLIVLGGIALYFLLSEHRAHFFGALPFLLLLACPLMHLFMHRGHHGHGGGHAHGQDDPSGSSESATPLTGKPGGQP
jgi:hypothetical protein